MIVKMKKVSVIVLTSGKEQSLEELRKIGTVHLNSFGVKSENLEVLLQEKTKTERAIMVLPKADPEKRISKAASDDQAQYARDTVIRIQAIQEEQRALSDETDRLSRECDRIRKWGDFEPDDIRELRKKGFDLRLYEIAKDKAKQLPESGSFIVVKKHKTGTLVAAFHEKENKTDTDPFAELPEFLLPERSLSQFQASVEENAAKQINLVEELAALIPALPAMKAELAKLNEAIEFEQARLSMGSDAGLSYVTGFIPGELVDDLKGKCADNGWAVLVQEPSEEDQVPTLVRNPKPVRIISPVFKLLGTVPGYREFDISILFLLFFCLFFAVIIGDAGYGLVLLGTAAFFSFRNKRKGKAIGKELILFLVLSTCAVIWGALSGTWFGSQAIAEAPFFRSMVISSISSFDPRSSLMIKYYCFIVGTVHIVIAHLWNFIAGLKKKPFIRAFADLGWISLILGLYYLVLNLVLDANAYPLPAYTLWLIAAGLAGIIIFSKQEGKFFKGLLDGISGLLTTFLDSIGAFADIISYIRLFAVGLATFEIAKSFNGMAASMGSSVVGIIGAVLILVLGHSLNLAMGALSVIVHGIRLNMLEFSGHLGMEWTGIPYSPFKKEIIIEQE